MKIGIFGGTFNPVHFGHLRAAEETREILGLEKVLFVPSGNPPLKTSDIADAGQRYEMVKKAVSGNLGFEVLDIECASPEKSYTVRTIEKLCGIYAGADLYFMLGIDAFLDLPSWYMPERLAAITNFAIISRPCCRFADLLSSRYLKADYEILEKLDGGLIASFRGEISSGREAVLVPVTRMAVSSTDIRRRLKEGLSIKYLLPAEVESFIISQSIFCG